MKYLICKPDRHQLIRESSSGAHETNNYALAVPFTGAESLRNRQRPAGQQHQAGKREEEYERLEGRGVVGAGDVSSDIRGEGVGGRIGSGWDMSSSSVIVEM